MTEINIPQDTSSIIFENMIFQKILFEKLSEHKMLKSGKSVEISQFQFHIYLLIGHCMVPPEEACGHKVGHHHVDGVVVMSQQDAEDTDSTQAPADPVVPPEPPWRICHP